MATRFEEPENRTGGRTEHLQNGANQAQTAVDFEELLSDLSAAFVRAPVNQIDSEVERWLERIVLTIGIDRSTVLQIDPDDGAIYTTHQWAREGVSTPDRGRRVKHDYVSFPWLTRKVLSGELVSFSRLEDLPPEASIDREDFRRVGNKSNVTIPVRVVDWWSVP